MTRNILSIICLIMLILPAAIFSHGMDILLIRIGTGVEARYDSGEPVSHAEVAIYSPADPEEPFQSGVTDRNGRFLFYPDLPGEWKVVINDWTGHGGTKLINIKSGQDTAGAADVSEKPVGRRMKILSGISVIFGLTGLFFYITARREIQRSRDAHS